MYRVRLSILRTRTRALDYLHIAALSTWFLSFHTWSL